MKPLVIIPSYCRNEEDIDTLLTCVRTIRDTAGNTCDVIVVDDHSPLEPEMLSQMHFNLDAYNIHLHVKTENSGFSATVNVGLKQALNEGRDAVLCNADIEFTDQFWLANMIQQPNLKSDGKASVVGALLLFPNGTIQHAGVYFSLLYRVFDHIYRYGPFDLPEAHVERSCPVTGALQFIRHDCLEEIGLYDETFKMGWEDVDYCCRVWQSGRECVYQPTVTAIHHEGLFRGAQRKSDKVNKWTDESWERFRKKWGSTEFSDFVPKFL